MNRFPLHARVECTDGACGESVAVIVNLNAGAVTHLVVADRSFPRSVQRLVPIEQVDQTGSHEIRLRCSEDDLAGMRPFAEVEYIETVEPGDDPNDPAYVPPLVTPSQVTLLPVEVEHLLPVELAVRRGTRVEATDGDVGALGELMLDPESGHLTHFILQEGHLWGKKEIALPLSVVDRVDEHTVYLKLDREAVKELPAIPVQRHGGRQGEQSEVFARVFDAPDGAGETLEFVKGLQARKILKIQDAAILVKDEDGEVSLKETGDLDTRQGRLLGAITGGLIGLLGGPVGVVVGALAGTGAGGLAARWIDMGFSDTFLAGMEERLQPGSSALILLVEHEWSQKLSEALAGTEGTFFRQSLTDEIVEQLAKEDVLERPQQD